MENKINIAELLKDCPSGMELDCTMYDNACFERIDKNINYPIVINIGKTNFISLTKEGHWNKFPNAKCVIFPKGKTTWEGFQRPFKDGDIIYNRLRKKICIYYLCEDEVPRIKGCRYNESNPQLQFEKLEYPIPIAIQDYRLATGEEKEKLFKAIKNNGYYWNTEIKTLEKYQSKDGDILATNDGKFIAIVKKNGGKYYVCCHTNGTYFEIDRSGWFDRLATEEEKQVLFNAITTNGYKWNAETKILENLPKFKVGDRVKHISTYISGIVLKVGDKGYYIDCPKNGGVRHISFTLEKDYELVPNKFDITTLVPFEDKVLVRSTDEGLWKPAVYGFSHSNGYYVVGGACWKQCIPHKGNEYLRGTTDACNPFYKTW